MRIAIILNMIAPYTTPVFAKLAGRQDCELLVVYETTMEPDRRWQTTTDLPFQHTVLRSWTLDLSWLAVGSGVKTRYDTYLYIPRRPLAPLRSFAPDVVIGAGAGIWSSPANLAALAARTRHGWGFVPWWGSFRRRSPTVPRRVAEPWVRKFVRAADAWMAYGTRAARDVIDLGADPRRTIIAPIVARLGNGVVPGSSASSPARLNRFLFVGRLIERKGVDVLIDAFRSLAGGELWIAGDGPIRERVQAAAAHDARVRFHGHVDDEGLRKLYSEAGALVVPSLYEPWGLVVNEALAYGLPVIATDEVGAAYDLVDPGVNGYMVPAGSARALAEAMRAVREWTPERFERSAGHSRAKLESWSTDRAADAMVDACRLALEHRAEVRSRT
jgi:glycosyltransferase involved in cell wall biosynthesis